MRNARDASSRRIQAGEERDQDTLARTGPRQAWDARIMDFLA